MRLELRCELVDDRGALSLAYRVIETSEVPDVRCEPSPLLGGTGDDDLSLQDARTRVLKTRCKVNRLGLHGAPNLAERPGEGRPLGA